MGCACTAISIYRCAVYEFRNILRSLCRFCNRHQPHQRHYAIMIGPWIPGSLGIGSGDCGMSGGNGEGTGYGCIGSGCIDSIGTGCSSGASGKVSRGPSGFGSYSHGSCHGNNGPNGHNGSGGIRSISGLVVGDGLEL